jgi:hypothetical protein
VNFTGPPHSGQAVRESSAEWWRQGSHRRDMGRIREDAEA